MATTNFKATAIAIEEEVLEERIDWKSLPQQLASPDNRNHIQFLANAEPAELETLFTSDEDSRPYAESCLNLLKLQNRKHLQYLVTLLAKLLTEDPRRGRIFYEQGGVREFANVWNSDRAGAYIMGKAAVGGAACLRWGGEDEVEYRNFCAWVNDRLRGGRGDDLILPLNALKQVAPNAYFQREFVTSNGIERLRHVLQNNEDHLQVTYLCVYVLWVVSFKPQYCSHELLCHGQLLHLLVNLAKAERHPKILRITLLLFENLLDQPTFNETVVLFGLYPVLTELDEAKRDDEEEVASIKKLVHGLEGDVRVLSSFERYMTELESGKLTRGPVHCAQFWKKYGQRFEDDEFENIKKLHALLNSDDAETVSVACYDIGEWARFYPDGKRIVSTIGAKTRIMEIIDDVNLPRDMTAEQAVELKKDALLAIQKLLIKDWTALGGMDV